MRGRRAVRPSFVPSGQSAPGRHIGSQPCGRPRSAPAGAVRSDPGVSLLSGRNDAGGFHAWTGEELARFEGCWPVGTRSASPSICCSTPACAAATRFGSAVSTSGTVNSPSAPKDPDGGDRADPAGPRRVDRRGADGRSVVHLHRARRAVHQGIVRHVGREGLPRGPMPGSGSWAAEGRSASRRREWGDRGATRRPVRLGRRKSGERNLHADDQPGSDGPRGAQNSRPWAQEFRTSETTKPANALAGCCQAFGAQERTRTFTSRETGT